MGGAELRIDWDRQGMALPLVGAFVFVALGWLMLVIELDPASASRHDNPWLVRPAGLAAIVFFGACALMGSWMITRPSPAFRLCAEGIEDRASLVRAGLVPWPQVLGIRLVSAMGQHCLAFDVADPEALLARARPWLRPIARANLRQCGTPLVVAVQFLKGGGQGLLDACEAFRKRHGMPSAGQEG